MSNAKRLIIIGLILTLGVGLIPLIAPNLLLGVRAIPILMVITAIAITVTLLLVSASREVGSVEKPKRTSDSTDHPIDRYTMLEQMVEALSTKERHYLQRLLDERSARHVQTLRDFVTDDGELRQTDTKRG